VTVFETGEGSFRGDGLNLIGIAQPIRQILRRRVQRRSCCGNSEPDDILQGKQNEFGHAVQYIRQNFRTIPSSNLIRLARPSLADRIIELEEAIAFYESQNDELTEEAALMEDFIISQSTPSRRPARYDWDDPDPGNAVLMMTEDTTRRNDPMSKRVDYIEQTVRGRPIAAPVGTASYLSETWEVTQS
jgi:hypothetical protein